MALVGVTGRTERTLILAPSGFKSTEFFVGLKKWRAKIVLGSPPSLVVQITKVVGQVGGTSKVIF